MTISTAPRVPLVRYVLFAICVILAPALAPLVWAAHRYTSLGELEILVVGVTFVALVGAFAVAAVVWKG